MGKLTEKCITSFQSEFLVMSCLRHPNVVLLMGACQGPKPCIIMEFMRGGSLSHLLHNRSELLSIEDTVMIAEDIARGLQYLHSINIIHRDLKSKVRVIRKLEQTQQLLDLKNRIHFFSFFSVLCMYLHAIS